MVRIYRLHSDTKANCQLLVASCSRLSPRGVNLFGVDAQFLHSLLRFLRVELLLASKAREGRSGNGLGIDLKMTAQMLAVITASKAIRSQREQTAFQPGSQLIRDCL